MKDTIKERFEKYYIPEPNSGCWLWIGGHNRKSGYGTFFMKTNSIKIKAAHRVSVFLFHKAYNPDLCVLHKCDNPACVNPDHLFQGTQKDNAIDRYAKGRANNNPAKGEGHYKAKLTVQDVIRIKKLIQNGIGAKEIHKEFNQVSFPAIEAIKYKRSWKQVII